MCVCVCQQEVAGHRQSKQVNYTQGEKKSYPSFPLCSVFVPTTVPSAPVLDSTPTVTTDSITISGSVPSGSVVTGYVVQWQRDTSLVCPDLRDDGSIPVASSSFTGHTVTELEPGNRYTITVTVSNGAGSGPVSDGVTAMTTVTDGKALCNSQVPYKYGWCYSPQLPLVLLAQSL